MVHADAPHPSAGGKHCASVASAWIAGSSPAMTNGTNAKERNKFGGETPTDAMGDYAVPTGTAAHPSGCARLSAFHRGSCPRDFRRQRLSVRPGFRGRGKSARSYALAPTGGRRPCAVKTGVTRPHLSQSSDSTSRAGRSAGRLMPDAARERIAKPPAGTALAPQSRECLPDRVRYGRGSTLYVSETGTCVNRSVT